MEQLSTNAYRTTAKFKGECAHCIHPTMPGQPIIYDRDAKIAAHVDCKSAVVDEAGKPCGITVPDGCGPQNWRVLVMERRWRFNPKTGKWKKLEIMTHADCNYSDAVKTWAERVKYRMDQGFDMRWDCRPRADGFPYKSSERGEFAVMVGATAMEDRVEVCMRRKHTTSFTINESDLPQNTGLVQSNIKQMKLPKKNGFDAVAADDEPIECDPDDEVIECDPTGEEIASNLFADPSTDHPAVSQKRQGPGSRRMLNLMGMGMDHPKANGKSKDLTKQLEGSEIGERNRKSWDAVLPKRPRQKPGGGSGRPTAQTTTAPTTASPHNAATSPQDATTTWVNKDNGDPYDVYIGRSGTKFHYGNPFSHVESSLPVVRVATRDEAVDEFEAWLDGDKRWRKLEPERRLWILDNLEKLHGKVLGCFCAPERCHGEVLAKLADAPHNCALLDRDRVMGKSSPGATPSPTGPSIVMPHDGTYTVAFPDGSHRTYRIEGPDPKRFNFFPTRCIASYLNGPDNTRNYKGFAFILPQNEWRDNGGDPVRVWEKFKNSNVEGKSKLTDGLRVLLSPARAMSAGEAYALTSSKCWHCNRKLTVPASLHRGLGPICADKLGIG